MDRIGSRGPQPTAQELRSNEPVTSATAVAPAEAAPASEQQESVPADDASAVAEASPADPQVVARQAANSYQSFQANGEGSRLVAGAAQARGQAATAGQPDLTAADTAARINQGAPPAAAAANNEGAPADDSALNPGELTGKGINIIGSNVDNIAELADGRSGSFASSLTDMTGGGTGGLSSRMPAVGSAGGMLGGAMALPGQVSNLFDGKGDANQVVGEAGQAVGTTASLAKDTIEGSQNLLRGSARRAAANAMRQRIPNAPASVVRAAAREAAEGALPEPARRDLGQNRSGGTRAQRSAAINREAAARAANPTRSTQAAAARAGSQAARQSGQTLAESLGTSNRAGASRLLRQGGQEASEAATRAVTRRAVLGTVARAGGRFVPGLNVAIAAADTATAVSTLRDPNASVGKKATSVITALGSGLAATNIPVVSQIGGAVSAISSFVGSFF